MKDEILVKYNGNKVPSFGDKMVYPGMNKINRADFESFINTPLGQKQLSDGVWVIIADSKEKESGEKLFSDLPVAKQKEFIIECYDVNELNELKDVCSKSVVKDIENRIDELTKVDETTGEDE